MNRKRLLIGGILALPALFLGGFLLWSFLARSQVGNQLERAKRLGLPMSQEEVDMPRDSARNAAGLLSQLGAPHADPAFKGIPISNLDRPNASLLATSLSKKELKLDLILSASTMSVVYTPDQFKFDFHPNPWGRSSTGVYVLALLAVDAGERGQWDQALDYVSAAARLTNLLTQVPSTVGLSRGRDMQRRTLQALIVLCRMNPPRGFGQSCLRIAESIELKPLRFYVQGDLLMLLDFLDRCNGARPHTDERYTQELKKLYKYTPVPHLDALKSEVLQRYLDCVEPALEESDPIEAIKRWHEAERKLPSAKQAVGVLEKAAVNYRRTGRAYLSATMQARMYGLVLREAAGLPIENEHRIDPFSGRAFMTSEDRMSKVVYSVGPDGVDNQGNSYIGSGGDDVRVSVLK